MAEEKIVSLVSDRVREMAKEPFNRLGATDLDLEYLLRIWDAKERVILEDLANSKPGQIVHSLNGQWGYVPNEVQSA